MDFYFGRSICSKHLGNPYNTGSNNKNQELNYQVEPPNFAELLTGARFSALCHWIDMVGIINTFGQVRAIVDFVGHPDIVDTLEWHQDTPLYKGKHYHHWVRSVQGLMVSWSLPQDLGTETGEIRVSIPGALLEQRDNRDQWRLLRGMHYAYKLRATRIDLALDVFGCSEIMDCIDEAVSVGNVAGFRVYDPRKPKDIKSGELRGLSHQFGSKSSDKHLIIYDKSLERKAYNKSVNLPEGADSGWIRLEARWHDALADEVFRVLFLVVPDGEWAEEKYFNYVAGSVLSMADFVDKSVSDRRCRQPRLPWYEQFINAVLKDFPPIAHRVARKKLFLEEMKRWVEYQVAGTLSVISQCMGTKFYSWLKNVTYIGKERMNLHQQNVVKIHRGQGFTPC